MMRLVWAQHALADCESIFRHFEAENPRAAVTIDEQLAAALRRLLDFPQSGRLGRVAGTRELVIPRTPYITAYLVAADSVRILRVLHGVQIWPDDIDTA